MACWYFRRLIHSYLGGILGERAKQRLARHLKRCPGCSREIELAMRTREVFSRWPRESVPSGVRERVLCRIRQIPEKMAVPVVPRVRFSAIAAGALVTVAIAAAILRVVPWQSASDFGEESWVSVATPGMAAGGAPSTPIHAGSTLRAGRMAVARKAEIPPGAVLVQFAMDDRVRDMPAGSQALLLNAIIETPPRGVAGQGVPGGIVQ